MPSTTRATLSRLPLPLAYQSIASTTAYRVYIKAV
jgi:hypothetical protein